MIAQLSASLVLIGLVIQVAALVPLRRLMALLPVGVLRKKWLVMAGLVFIFIAGYFGYIVVFWGQQTEYYELIIPGIFLFGALFVWLTIVLSLQTATDLRRIEEELVRKEKLAVLGQVAGSVGHELRNPLGVMSNAVYFLQTVLPDADESVKEYLDIIKSEITGSERIVSDLLDSVRTKPAQPEAIGVVELIEQTLRKLVIPSSVTVKLEIPETLPHLWVDPQQIHQVFRNLISNAVEAMPEGGTLEIRAVADEEAKKITLSVHDSGIGMTAEHLSKLFQPLFTTKTRGIGLGLVVVKNLTKANGGSVAVHSESGKGTLFAINLPIEETA